MKQMEVKTCIANEKQEPQLIKEHCRFCGHNVKIGKITGGMYLREHVGEGDTEINGEIKKFSISISATNKTPIVEYGKQNFSLSWQDILELAVAAGLFEARDAK